MKNKWILFVSMYLAIISIDAAAPMVCSPGNFSKPGFSPYYGNSSYPRQHYGNPNYPNSPAHMGNYGYPNGNQGYGQQQFYNQQRMPYPPAMPQMAYNGIVPPAGMAIQQPSMPVAPAFQAGAIPYAGAMQATTGGKCTCQKAGSTTTLQTEGKNLQTQGLSVVNEGGVLKVYNPSAPAAEAAAHGTKKPGIKVIYDENPQGDIILVRPTTISEDQKRALEGQITGVPVVANNSSSNADFNNALAGMGQFSSGATPVETAATH